MEDENLPSSQGSVFTFSDAVGYENISSSPIRPSKTHGSKPKARPTVTPRTFTRFFTPRSFSTRSGKLGASRQALRDITASASNRESDVRFRSIQKETISILEDTAAVPARKKRKTQDSLVPNVIGSSPLKRVSAPAAELTPNETEDDSDWDGNEEKTDSPQETVTDQPVQQTRPIVCSRQRGAVGGLLHRELGLNPPKHRLPLCHGRDAHYEIANFYTTPRDRYLCYNLGDPTEHAIPFCIASCNTNSLVAVGNEEGGIRLLETAKAGKPHFNKAYLTFRPHTNAILDLAFSPDDLRLATASGDQTSRIIDMPTQRAVHTLVGHTSSLKQVIFQPNSLSVIATSGRDGSVRLWDLRCRGSDTPVHTLRVSMDGPEGVDVSRTSSKKMTYSRCVDAIIGAHSSRTLSAPSVSKAVNSNATNDIPSKSETPSRRGDASITALSFLPPGREHLLLTASEADATVKLWDLRTTYSHRRSSHPVPLSSTGQPQSHTKYRHYGVTSMALSGDGARLYSLCRDSTVYAYSTAHLVLGHAPELGLTTASSEVSTCMRKSRFSRSTEKEGAGPMYGFRHPQLLASTFYVKIAVRPANNDRSELLAVGSGSVNGCAVVFPTDERYMQKHSSHRSFDAPSFDTTGGATAIEDSLPTPPSSVSKRSLPCHSSRPTDTIPIYNHGIPLVRGHENEVTALNWAHGGELVTVSDDFTSRCWREDIDRSRDLRMGGEGEGRRWGSGWADIPEGWDDE
ncbi:MAG: hypothetical protein L6R42_003577 [Xanthoria sp. 1 TBL-2021]|nr:MAG: hypothetical protein L6R42_003577 [Xanthoria sp. 1 TBL-2021]